MSIRSKKTVTALVSLSFLCSLVNSVDCHAAPAKTGARRPAPAQSRPAQAPAKVGGNTVTGASGALNSAYNSYLNVLRQKVDNQWYLADGNNHVVISMTVGTDGSVTELDITSSPKNTQAEQAASDAFNHCQPLAVLPAGSNAVKMTLTFDSHADPHGDNDRHITGRIDAPGSSAASSSSNSNAGGSSSSSPANSSSTGSDSSSSSSASSSSSNESSESKSSTSESTSK